MAFESPTPLHSALLQMRSLISCAQNPCPHRLTNQAGQGLGSLGGCLQNLLPFRSFVQVMQNPQSIRQYDGPRNHLWRNQYGTALLISKARPTTHAVTGFVSTLRASVAEQDANQEGNEGKECNIKNWILPFVCEELLCSTMSSILANGFKSLCESCFVVLALQYHRDWLAERMQISRKVVQMWNKM